MATANELKPRILSLVNHIPPGNVATYVQLATLAGAPSHSRLVGRILRELPSATRLPWFRVISASGRISNPNAIEQRQRLYEDGVVVGKNNRISLQQYQWQP